jgi:hypothetical protein
MANRIPLIVNPGAAQIQEISATDVLTIPGTATANVVRTDNYQYANGQPFSGGGGGNYGNANVATFLADFGSNNVSTTGNVTAGTGLFGEIYLDAVSTNKLLYSDGNRYIYDTDFSYDSANSTITGSGAVSITGNITGNYIFGNGSQLTGLSSTYGDSNVATFLADFGSNNISTTGSVTVGEVDIGANLYIGPGPGGPTFIVGNVDTGLVTIAQGANGAATVGWTENLLAPGNVTFIDFNNSGDPGNILVTTGNSGSPFSWKFDNVGQLTVPANSIVKPISGTIGIATNDGNTYAWAGDGGFYIDTLYNTDEYEWQFDNTANLIFPSGGKTNGLDYNAGSASATVSLSAFAPDGNTVSIQAQGNTSTAVIQTFANATSSTYNWTFDSTGNLNLPQGGYIGAAGVKGDGTMLTGGTGNIASLTSFYADAPGIYSSCVTVNADGTLNITTYGNGTGQLGQWQFTGPNVTVPGNGYITTAETTTGVGGNSVNIQAGSSGLYSPDPGGNLNLKGGYGNFGDGGGPTGGSVNIAGGDSSDNQGGNVNIAGGNGTSTGSVFLNSPTYTPPVNSGEGTGERAVIAGTRRVVGGVTNPTYPYTVVLDGNATPILAYEGGQYAYSIKVSFAIQSNNVTWGWEQFDVAAVRNYVGGVTFTVSNRVNSNPSNGDTQVSAQINGGTGAIELLLQQPGPGTAYVTYDAVEFNLMVD